MVQLRPEQAVRPARRPLSAAGIKTSDYVDALYNDYKFKEQHYALPYARSTPLFYYNKDLWKAAGLEDRGPKTWQEFQEWAPKIAAVTGSDKSVFEMPDGSNYLDWYFQNIVWSFGGSYSNEWTPTFTDAKTVEAGTVPRRTSPRTTTSSSTRPRRPTSAPG